MNINKLKIKTKLAALWKKGAFHILIGGFLGKFVALFGSIIIVRLLTKQEYGMLSYTENIYSYAYVLAGMGLSNSILRFVVLAEHRNSKKAYFDYALKKGFAFNVILILIVSIINLFYPHASEFAIAKYLLIIMLIALPFQHITDDSLYMERAMFSNDRFTYFSILVTVLLLLGRVFGAILGGLNGVVWSQILINLGLAIFFIFSIKKKYFNVKEEKYTLSINEKKMINGYSLQYMITNGFWTIFMLNDVFLLGRLCNDSAILADYRVAYVLPGCLSILSSAIGTFVSPYFVQNENNHKWVRTNYWKVFFSNIVIVGIGALMICFFAEFIITLVYGKQYLNVIPLMRLLTLAAFINCGIRFTSANLLSAMGQVKYNMIVSFGGILFQIALNLFLIPIYGVMGAGYTSVIVYFIMGVILLFIFSKRYKLFNG